MNPANKGFHALHYTYIKPPGNPFPRILSNSVSVFRDHIKKLSRTYQVVSPQQVLDFYRGKKLQKTGLLFTFDDGYSDHYYAAKILRKLGIRALFFIPTCILTDDQPINPTIIHYCIAKYGTLKFIASLKEAAKKFKIPLPALKYKMGDDYWPVIAEIKKISKYILSPSDSRKIFLYVYESTFHRDYKNAMEIMYMTRAQIKEVIEMGHSIGSHTHNHFSIGSTNLSKSKRAEEIISSGQILKKYFGVKINALAYPYGESSDCLSAKKLLDITENYDLAFTVKEKINSPTDSPLEIGRYAPLSKDTAEDIIMKLIKISKNS